MICEHKIHSKIWRSNNKIVRLSTGNSVCLFVVVVGFFCQSGRLHMAQIWVKNPQDCRACTCSSAFLLWPEFFLQDQIQNEKLLILNLLLVGQHSKVKIWKSPLFIMKFFYTKRYYYPIVKHNDARLVPDFVQSWVYWPGTKNHWRWACSWV